jgi:uncharacterized protein (DUF983 family)
MSDILRLMQCKCPICGQENVFEPASRLNIIKFPEIKRKCSYCGFRYEKEPGFFYGSMYVSYGLGVMEGLLIYLVCRLFLEAAFDLRILFIIISSQILFRQENYRYSRMIWMNMFLEKSAGTS